MKPLHRIIEKIYLMYSNKNTTFSKEFYKKAAKGEFIKED